MVTYGQNSAHLDSLILKALADAWAKGLDNESQIQAALDTVHRSNPVIPKSEVLDAIRRLRGWAQ